MFITACVSCRGLKQSSSRNVAVDTMIAFATALKRGTRHTVSKNRARELYIIVDLGS